MSDHGDALTLARQAHAANDWPTAARRFSAVPQEQLTTDDLVQYFEARFWLGDIEPALHLAASAYDALLADSRTAEAVKIALWLGAFTMARGDEPQGVGWWGRAARLAQELPEGPAHGYVACFTGVEKHLLAGDWTAAVEAARRVHQLGRSFDDPDLVAYGLQGEGRALLHLGRVVDGLAMIDEAMVSALNGRNTSLFTGTLYCHAVVACHAVSDVRRMAHWTELSERWFATMPSAGVFDAMCRVHRAQLQLLRDEWDEAERTAAGVIRQLEDHRVDYAAEAWYVVGETRRLRGDPAAADAYDEARARGRDPQPGSALLLLQRGDAAGAAAAVRSAIAAAGTDPLRRAPICAAAVEIALAAKRPDDAKAAEAELATTAATYATSGLEAMAAGARGAVLLDQGRVEEALPVLRDACRRWHELGATYDAAGTRFRLAVAYRALGDEASAAAEHAQAVATYQHLGAHRPAPKLPDGLTRRECELMPLLADGRSNREIAEALFISERTVARHLTNIFHKIGVTSRTQAARYAIDHGMTAPR